ncbi:MAG: hypothetical protein WCX28_01225 [Bacteriovoracaceae bacterium]|nr:hypothetical protein [Bacteroidota bacterium]
MRTLIILIAIVGIQIVAAQFKPKTTEQPRVSDSFIQPQSTSEWFSLFNPNNFHMRHSYSASYSMGGGTGIALQRYTNTMLYQFLPNLEARVDLSLQQSPYSTFEYRLQNQFNKAFVSRVELNYRPTDNTVIRLQYREIPYSYFGSRYNRPFGGMFSGLDEYED